MKLELLDGTAEFGFKLKLGATRLSHILAPLNVEATKEQAGCRGRHQDRWPERADQQDRREAKDRLRKS